ncbi:MAG: tetratricopeptide repeat protein, partial [Candidatus Omnitrophota bacterium]
MRLRIRTKKAFLTAIVLVAFGLGAGAPGVFSQTGDKAAANEKPKRAGHAQDIARVKEQIAADPRNTELWMELGKFYGWDEDTENAVKAYEKVLEINPAHLEARKKLVDFYSWTDRPAQSAEQIEYLLEREPENLELMEKLSDRYRRLERYGDAEKLYRKILEKDPGNVKAQRGLGDISASSARYDDAIRRYREILPSAVSEKEKLDLYDRVADTYYYAQDYGKSREYAQEILRLDPDNEEALERMRKIEEHFRPRVFNDFRDVKLKGDSERVYNSAGFIQPTEVFTLTGTHKHYRKYDHEVVTDRYGYDSAHAEISKYLGEGLTLAVGGEGKFYTVED